MTSDEGKTKVSRFTVKVADLAIAVERKAEFERSVDDMADRADSLGYLDPLEGELSLVFDPRV
jgi:hypothetical protein